jgi:hypothetical protein
MGFFGCGQMVGEMNKWRENWRKMEKWKNYENFSFA